MTGDKNAPARLVAEGPALLELHDDGVARIRLNRPESSNGLNMELLKALHEVVMKVHGDGRVRALLLTGEGKHFCAGGDVHTFLSKGEALPDYIRPATSYLQIIVALLMRLNAPVVTAVQGFAAGGGGMGLVCSSDIVIAGESSKFLAGATRVGMVPDAGVSVTLT
nr:enoyl-CoA hydratase/isomerase family protein [Pseudomonadota bacterium]